MAKNNDISKQVLQVQQRFSIIGQAQGLRAAIERALRVAQVDLSVLVIGESGSGKEHFPKIIYENSPRKHKKYIAVNCGAIPEGTSRARSLAPTAITRATLRRPMAVSSSWTRWPRCP